MLVADRARQRRQVHLGFRVRLADEFHRARNSASGHHRLFRHAPACRPRRRFRAGLDRKLGRRPGQAAGGLRAIRVRSRNTVSSISSSSRWNRSPGIPTRASASFRTSAPRSKCTSSISPRPAWSTTSNGVVIKSFPAIHIYDGPVSYRLEWNGLCVRVFRRYHAEPVLGRQRPRRRLADPRMFQHGEAADRTLGLRREECARHRHDGAYRAGGGRARCSRW